MILLKSLKSRISEEVCCCCRKTAGFEIWWWVNHVLHFSMMIMQVIVNKYQFFIAIQQLTQTEHVGQMTRSSYGNFSMDPDVWHWCNKFCNTMHGCFYLMEAYCLIKIDLEFKQESYSYQCRHGAYDRGSKQSIVTRAYLLPSSLTFQPTMVFITTRK